MSRMLGYTIWLPAAVTIAAWLLLIFGIDSIVSRTMADLGGLLYLLASPFIYRGLKRLIPDERGHGSALNE